MIELLLDSEVFQVSGLALRQVCRKFATDPLPAQYRVVSSVSKEVFEVFLLALEGGVLEVTKTNLKEISTLCHEFGFELESPSFRFCELERTIDELKVDIVHIFEKMTEIENMAAMKSNFFEEFTELRREVSTLRNQISSPPAIPSTLNGPPSPSPKVAPPSRPSPPAIPSDLNGPPSPSLPTVPPSPQPPLLPSTPPLDSRILSDIPEIFAEFRKFSLLWRGSRDGFEATKFHRRCDGHPNTLTVILDTKGNIFGGFTPLKWESPVWNGNSRDDDNHWRSDDNQKSFVFTLKNPHNIPAKRFGLKAAKKHRAIQCDSRWGPRFGDCDISVCDDCNAPINRKSMVFLLFRRCNSTQSFGHSYINDTGLDGEIVLTGVRDFVVTEIEVFEIRD
jgi:hypothetical protein